MESATVRWRLLHNDLDNGVFMGLSCMKDLDDQTLALSPVDPIDNLLRSTLKHYEQWTGHLAGPSVL